MCGIKLDFLDLIYEKMDRIHFRNYNCKDEELAPICNYAANGLNRDLADFSTFSPNFNNDYLTGFKTRILNASDLVEPQSETQELKIITLRFHSTLDGLIDPLNRLTGYINLAQLEQIISLSDFGIKYLRKSIASGDAEGVIQALHSINGNISKYKDLLKAQGMPDDLVARFANAATAVAEDKQKQFAIISNRKRIVQNNLESLNGLYGQLNEILKVGKILYKTTDPLKAKEYAFTELKKQVHREVKPVPAVQKVPVN